MDATEGARISLPSPDPIPQSKRGPRDVAPKKAEARAGLREGAGARSTSLAEASVRGPLSSRLGANGKKRREEAKPLIGIILGVRGRRNNFKKIVFWGRELVSR
jgi:hypothetical protein